MNCRLCEGSTSPLFSLGNHYLSDFVAEGAEGVRSPLDLEMCDDCGLVQLVHSAPVDYTKYWYRSGVTATMRAALQDVVDAATQRVQLNPGDVVLDIGSNDGTLLRCYPGDVRKVGVEPALNLADANSGVDVLIQEKWCYAAYRQQQLPFAKIITACGMMYDLEEPCSFVLSAANALHPEGVFVAQLMCLRQTLESNDVGNICHEHLEYYKLRNLYHLYDCMGLRVIHVEENAVNGGSYRIFAVKDARKVHGDKTVTSMLRLDDSVCTRENVMAFYARAERNKKKCVEYVREAQSHGCTVALYGASTKGNTILQYYWPDGDHGIEYAADRSPEKHGLYTVGSNIEIVSEDAARERNPDYFLVMPYAFINEFMEREKEWRNGGGKFIVPLPEFRVL